MSAFTKEFVMHLAEKAGLEPRLWNHTDAFERFFEFAVTAEREACAKVCEDSYTGEEAWGDWPTPDMCAVAIRARGEA